MANALELIVGIFIVVLALVLKRVLEKGRN